MYISSKLPVDKIKRGLKKYKGTPEYDGALLMYLKGYFKLVLLADNEKIDVEERKEWVKAYSDIAFRGVVSEYWEKYKKSFEEIIFGTSKKNGD